MRIRSRLGVGLVLFALAGGAVAATLPARAQTAAPAVTTRFEFTGAEQPYTVPASVCSISVLAAGGSGGSFRNNHGMGGTAQGTLPVTPGQTLSVVVGGFGESGANVAAGGFPNGGEGGTGVTGGDGPLFWSGGAGGGSSDVRTAAGDPTTRLIIGGGGGGAAFDIGVVTNYRGGDGGGTSGTAGADANAGVAGGKPGTDTAPGAGGQNLTIPTTSGEPGVATAGGNGGDSTSGGGGGGGGYFGGGGGAGAILTENRGAGGGGSGFGPAGTVFGINTVAVPTAGFVVITDVPNSCPVPVVRFAG